MSLVWYGRFWFAFTNDHNSELNRLHYHQLTTSKHKISQNSILARIFFTSGKDYKDFWPLARNTRTKVVLARILEKQGSGNTPALNVAHAWHGSKSRDWTESQIILFHSHIWRNSHLWILCTVNRKVALAAMECGNVFRVNDAWLMRTTRAKRATRPVRAPRPMRAQCARLRILLHTLTHFKKRLPKYF